MEKNVKCSRKLGNKGFSLVELIVVIAIMGVLMVVLVPQLTRYVDNARKQNDDSMCAEVFRLCETMMIENEAYFNDGTNSISTIVIADGAITITETADAFDSTAIEAAIAEVLKITGDTADDEKVTIGFSSNARKAQQYTIEFDYPSGAYPTVTITGDGWTDLP